MNLPFWESKERNAMLYIITFLVGNFVGMLLTCIVVSGKDK